MMTIPRPTDAELTILRVLWQEGSATVRRVLNVLSKEKEVGYTSVLKTLQVMTGKGLVVRDESRRSHVYAPAETEDQTQRTMVGYLLSRAFRGSAMKLVMQALSVKPASKEELDQIRELLDSANRSAEDRQ